jgi:hypothetical protein
MQDHVISGQDIKYKRITSTGSPSRTNQQVTSRVIHYADISAGALSSPNPYFNSCSAVRHLRWLWFDSLEVVRTFYFDTVL